MNVNSSTISQEGATFFREGVGQLENVTREVSHRYTSFPIVARIGGYLAAENMIESVGGSLSICTAQALSRHSAVKHYYSSLSQFMGKSIGCLAIALTFRHFANQAFQFINAPNISNQEFAKRCAICVFATLVVFSAAKESGTFLSEHAIGPSVEGIAGIVGGFAAIYAMGSQEEMIPSEGEWYDSYFVKSLQAMLGCAIHELCIDSDSILYFPASLMMATICYNIVDIYRVISSIQEQRALDGVLPRNIANKAMRQIYLPVSSQLHLAEAVASGQAVKKRVVDGMNQVMKHLLDQEDCDLRIVFKEVVKQIQNSETFKNSVRELLEPNLKEIGTTDLGKITEDVTEALIQSAIKGLLNYLQRSQDGLQSLEAEEQIYALSLEFEEAESEEAKTRILEEITILKQEIRIEVEQLTLALDQHLAAVDLPIEWKEVAISQLRNLADQKFERPIESITAFANKQMEAMERKLFGFQVRYDFGKKAYEHILQAKILGLLPHIACSLVSGVMTRSANLTEGEEKELYKRGVAELSRHYSQATNAWISPVFPVISKIFNSQMEHSRLNAS